MSTRTKLELTWIGKENRPKLEVKMKSESSEYSCRSFLDVRLRHGRGP